MKAQSESQRSARPRGVLLFINGVPKHLNPLPPNSVIDQIFILFPPLFFSQAQSEPAAKGAPQSLKSLKAQQQQKQGFQPQAPHGDTYNVCPLRSRQSFKL